MALMERTAYARLYATLTGAFLVLLGFVGLLVNTEFSARELTDELLGFYTINGWSGVFHVGAGLIGLVLARPLPRLYALLAGIVFTALGVWGILATNGTWLLDGLPATRWVNLINLLIGLGGLCAYAASRWDRITAWAGGLGARFEARAERRRQKRRRRKVRKRRATANR
jgi:hypothetical protein